MIYTNTTLDREQFSLSLDSSDKNLDVSYSKNSVKNNISTQELVASIQLIRTPNIGPITFYKLLEKFNSAENAVDNFREFTAKSSYNYVLYDHNLALKELENTINFGAKIITYRDDLYPQILREIPDAPPIITIKGNDELLAQEKIAIVGPRNASQNALTYAKKFALLLGEASVVSVSGLARGVDTVVHQSSILSGTIAVLAGGINNIYPPENSQLYQEIAECGVILTEMPFGFEPQGKNFIQRNRLISGLSLATIVVEAGIQSGSLSTARFAMEQNREVFAVPGSPFDPRCQGTNRLIKEGAHIITEAEDILHATSQKNYLLKKSSQFSKVKEQYKFSNDEIGKVEKQILESLNTEPTSIDFLISQLQIPINLFNTAIMELEIYNKISINYGKIVKLIEV